MNWNQQTSAIKRKETQTCDMLFFITYLQRKCKAESLFDAIKKKANKLLEGSSFPTRAVRLQLPSGRACCWSTLTTRPPAPSLPGETRPPEKWEKSNVSKTLMNWSTNHSYLISCKLLNIRSFRLGIGYLMPSLHHRIVSACTLTFCSFKLSLHSQIRHHDLLYSKLAKLKNLEKL